MCGWTANGILAAMPRRGCHALVCAEHGFRHHGSDARSAFHAWLGGDYSAIRKHVEIIIAPLTGWAACRCPGFYPRGLGSRSTELPLQNGHRCFIGKPPKPCCGHAMKAAGRAHRPAQSATDSVPAGRANRQAGADTQCRRLSLSVVAASMLSARSARRSVRSADCGGPAECAAPPPIEAAYFAGLETNFGTRT
jgi:hypothetical protein